MVLVRCDGKHSSINALIFVQTSKYVTVLWWLLSAIKKLVTVQIVSATRDLMLIQQGYGQNGYRSKRRQTKTATGLK